MAASSTQLNLIIERLFSRTKNGELRWESSLSNRRIQVRLGDFLIQLQQGQGIAKQVTMTVNSLNGETIAATSGTQNTLLNAPGTTIISTSHQELLNNVYAEVVDKDTRLDDLIKLLK